MLLTQFLQPENIHYNVVVSSKKRLLELIGKIAADAFQRQYQNEICSVECFSHLFKREKLGCTYIGNGIALPYAKLEVSSDKLLQPLGLFLKLEHPIDYEANDGKNVDLVYTLLFPSGCCERYRASFLSITEMLNDKNLAKQLRSAQSAEEIWQILDRTVKLDENVDNIT